MLKHIKQENIAISDVSRAELFYGARNKRELRLIRKDLNKLNILPITIDISMTSVTLVEQYSLSHNLTLPDALIAATALFHDIELFMLNLKDFRYIQRLSLYSF